MLETFFEWLCRLFIKPKYEPSDEEEKAHTLKELRRLTLKSEQDALYHAKMAAYYREAHLMAVKHHGAESHG